MFSNVV